MKYTFLKKRLVLRNTDMLKDFLEVPTRRYRRWALQTSSTKRTQIACISRSEVNLSKDNECS